MLVLATMTFKPLLEDINQIIQTVNTKIRMSMLAEMTIPLIHEQHRCCTGHMTSCHIINAITNLQMISGLVKQGEQTKHPWLT